MTYQRLFGKGQRLRYLCQDETRLGLKTETGKVIMAFGVKPITSVLWKRDNFWLYGVVEPLSGWHFCQEYDRLNTQRQDLRTNAIYSVPYSQTRAIPDATPR